MGQGRHTLRSINDPVYPRLWRETVVQSCDIRLLKQFGKTQTVYKL